MSSGHHTGTVHGVIGRGHHAVDANGGDERDHSAHYLFLIIGAPLVAFLIAASSMFESHGLPIPLVRIGTGVSGLILQTIPFMLSAAMMSAAVSTFVSADALDRHMPRSLAGGLAMAIIGGLCLPVCDCMVVPTFANLVRKRLPLPYATALLCAAPAMNPMAIWSTWFAFTGSPWMVTARVGLGVLVAIAVGLSFALRPAHSSTVRDIPLATGRTPACNGCTARQPAERDGRSRFAHFLRHTHDDVMRMMPILLFGTIAASVVRTALSPLPDDSVTIDGISAVALIAAAMAMAFLCSLCSTSDAVIATSITGVLPTSAMLAFLLFGPMLDLKNTLMLVTECRPRFIIRFITTVTAACFLVAVAIHLTTGA
ncbi:putative membrane spanning protein [Bifidobacterium breve JCM 7019]|uniref:permease n=1 Tax=Bifidobacterium breve TaxID=1685 RepID=UPI0003EFC32A|nr:permease [Bifidobacterium breve]AHJ18985.1 putative membrane spanning protein [Bifidobacterium breve JCM 7019]